MKIQKYAAVLTISTAVLFLYWPVFQYGFIGYDDLAYVRDNPWIRDGLTSSGVRWAFTTLFSSNWYPLTWLSHMLDFQLFGAAAGFHHLVNVFLHLVNSLLLFFVLSAMTGARWKSFFTAVLFALHPQHVESVAWISERKDVLSTLFWIVGLGMYDRYVKQPGAGRYLAVLAAYFMGLLAKPMVVTFPFVLLILDVWPFHRLRAWGSRPHTDGSGEIRALPVGKALLEKVPLLALTVCSSVLAVVAQSRGGAMTPLEGLSFASRISSAFFAYTMYLWKTVYPLHLAVIYPHPDGGHGMWRSLLSAMFLAVVTALAVMKWKKAPFFPVGWLWFLGTLVPVIGLVQVGKQYMADRYMYIPHIGLFVILVWGIDALTEGWPGRGMWLKASSAVVVAGMIFLSRTQVGYWRDTSALFRHALQTTKNNWVAAYFLGLEMERQGKIDEAIGHFADSARFKPLFFEVRLNMGNALLKEKRIDEAIEYYAEAWNLRPQDPALPFNLGLAYWQKGDMANSELYFRIALQLKNDHVKAHTSLGTLLYRRGSLEEALTHLEASLRIDPSNPKVHALVADISRRQGKMEKAAFHYREALRLQPGMPEAQSGLSEIRLPSPGDGAGTEH